MARNTYKLLSERYLEVEVNANGTHKSTHNVDMARTKANQAAEVAPELYQLLQQLDPNEPLHAWMVTHVTQAADMLQDVLAALKEDLAEPNTIPVKEGEFEPNPMDGEDGTYLSSDIEGAV
jgi:hypothetical protein